MRDLLYKNKSDSSSISSPSFFCSAPHLLSIPLFPINPKMLFDLWFTHTHSASIHTQTHTHTHTHTGTHMDCTNVIMRSLTIVETAGSSCFWVCDCVALWRCV